MRCYQSSYNFCRAVSNIKFGAVEYGSVGHAVGDKKVRFPAKIFIRLCKNVTSLFVMQGNNGMRK
jgi:hypothetical protein